MEDDGDSYGDDDEMGKEKKLGWQWRTMAIVTAMTMRWERRRSLAVEDDGDSYGDDDEMGKEKELGSGGRWR